MTLARRAFLRLAACAAAVPAVSPAAWAKVYPNRSVRIIVGTAPGGAADIFARLIGDWLSKRLGQPFIVENRQAPAASSRPKWFCARRRTAIRCSWRSPRRASSVRRFHDGLNFVRDSAPVAMLVQEPIILSVNPSLPPKTFPEFVAYAKANRAGSTWRPGQRDDAAYRRRDVQDHDRRRHDTRSLSRGCAGAHRSRADRLRSRSSGRGIAGAREVRTHSRPGGDFGGACGGIAGRADDR